MTENGMTLQLNRLQYLFVQWRAEVLGISVQESAERFIYSWSVFPHDGDDYRMFIKQAQALLLPFYGDAETEITEAYRMHQELHMLRWMSYPQKAISLDVAHGLKEVRFLDYGCGMGALSIETALYWREKGVDVKLFMVDIETIMTDFLRYALPKLDIKAEFRPPPRVPVHGTVDVALVSEVWEHLYNPYKTLDDITNSLKVGGYLVTMLDDRQPEMFHVTPDLSPLRDQFANLPYEQVGEYVWMKNG